MRTLLTLGFVAIAAGCGSSKSSGFDDGSSGTSGGSSGGASGGLLGDGGGGGGNGCSDAAKLVYVVSDANDLYSFRPDKLSFTKIGALSCNSAGATPNSMAVDRNGVAWVNYSNGLLFKVSTSNASCESTPFAPNQHNFMKFGMAFSSNSAGSSDESLYVCGIVDGGLPGLGPNGLGLAKIDLATFKLTPIGDFSGQLRGRGAELTGTGDGKLYGFFTTNPAQLAEINKFTGATTNPRQLDNVSTGTAWAFSFWGGDFYFYTADVQNKGLSDTTDLTRLKAATDNSLGIAKAQIGFRIVGAGVSTCAPTTPPK